MPRVLEELAQEARQLPSKDRISLAMLLLDEETGAALTEADRLWEREIRARILAVDEGRVGGIPLSDARVMLDERLAR